MSEPIPSKCPKCGSSDNTVEAYTLPGSWFCEACELSWQEESNLVKLRVQLAAAQARIAELEAVLKDEIALRQDCIDELTKRIEKEFLVLPESQTMKNIAAMQNRITELRAAVKGVRER